MNKYTRIINMVMVFFTTMSITTMTPLVVAGEAKHPSQVVAPKNLDYLKSLEGNWVGTHKNMQGVTEQVKLSFKKIAGGTAVEERIFVGTPQEMVSVYHGADNGKDIIMTHYCMMGNQPRLKMSKIDGKTLEFEFLDGTGIKGNKVGYMGGLKLTLANEKELVQEWAFMEDGKVGKVSIFKFKKLN